MKRASWAAGCLALIACSSAPSGGDASMVHPDADPGELIASLDFDELPPNDLWAYSGGLNEIVIDPQFGAPAPSLYTFLPNWSISFKQPVLTSTQSVMTSLETSMVQNTDANHAVHTMTTLTIFRPSERTDVAFIRLYVNNKFGEATPTVRVQCTPEQLKPLGGVQQGTVVTAPYNQEDLHKLRVSIDASGMRANMDGIDYCVDPTITSATGDLSVGLAIELDRLGYPGNGTWLDNLRFYRGH
jgi:hypothetical protein